MPGSDPVVISLPLFFNMGIPVHLRAFRFPMPRFRFPNLRIQRFIAQIRKLMIPRKSVSYVIAYFWIIRFLTAENRGNRPFYNRMPQA